MAYDYGDHQLGAGVAGGNGPACSVETGAGFECQQCMEAQCKTQLSQCAATLTCEDFALCVVDCCEPACFTACDEGIRSPIRGEIYDCICNFCEDECTTVAPACE